MSAGLITLIFSAAAGIARAQETPAPAPPTPAPESTPTFMDRAYDGNLHVTVAPYIWLPTVRANYQYTIPTLRGYLHGPVQGSAGVGPTSYLSKLNSAAMFAFDARKGSIDVFGDYIYLNASASASGSTTLSGPLGQFQLPVSFSSTAHLRSSIWELAGGFTVARGHNADLSTFLGYRDFPLSLNFGYTANVTTPKGLLSQTGSINAGSVAQDLIWGLRGRAFFGDGHWYVPYYFDYGTAVGQLSNSTWEAYTGAGYTFNHGQSILAVWRSLNFLNLPPTSTVQKLNFAGPLIGYTFGL
ncbi:MAG TPA: hypothetical protein VFF63_00165 [Candidatus Babeliales bacterium]|nr:hypothetical protein [Candidatus Babeliales bacterium]